MKYEIIQTTFGDSEIIVRTDDDGTVSYIPPDPANSDYQAYLAEQSTPIVTPPVVEETPVVEESAPEEEAPPVEEETI
jgi:hypothetical protein